MSSSLHTVNGVEIRIEDYSPADEFRDRYGLPRDADAEVRTAWEATALPTAQKLRRLATLYLHAVRGDLCDLCGLSVDIELEVGHPARAQLDHIVPRARGGLDVWGNVRVVHGSCNSERAHEWLTLSVGWARRIMQLETRRYLGEITKSSVARSRVTYYKGQMLEAQAAAEAELNRRGMDPKAYDHLRVLAGRWSAQVALWKQNAKILAAAEAEQEG